MDIWILWFAFGFSWLDYWVRLLLVLINCCYYTCGVSLSLAGFIETRDNAYIVETLQAVE